MKKDLTLILKTMLPLSVLLFVVHRFIIRTYIENKDAFYTIEKIYLFHILVTVVICVLLTVVKNSFYEKTGMAFMALSILKMLVSVIFLIPLIQLEGDLPLLDLATFFIAYFSFLLYEIIFSVTLLKGEKK